MTSPGRNKFRTPPSGSRVAAIVVLVLIFVSVACYYLFSPTGKNSMTQQNQEPTHAKPSVPGKSLPQPDRAEPLVVPPTQHKEQNKYPPTTATPEIEKPESVDGASGRLAIIIDDMGSSVSEARSLAAIKVPLTFAIIPGLRAATEVAAYATSNGIETMIHIPMQSKGWPARRLEANGLLVAMDAEELQERVSGFVQQFPGAVGVNNHMGSEFTEQEEKMTAVLQTVKKSDLFFIDSVTSPKSAGLRVAQRLGVRSARRNVFLDNEQERSYILGQLNQAVRLARKNGSAIAICHPHTATIAALSAALPGIADQGIRFVPVSQLVK